MRISVIIPCRNELRHIGGFLKSLLAQELDPGQELEILVADGTSDDGTRDLLLYFSEVEPRVRVIDNPRQIVSTGLNAAIAASTGEVIVRLDVHTVYAPNYIRECVRVLGETGADNVGGPWVAEGRGVVGRAIAAAFQSPFCAGGGKAHDPQYEGEVDTVYLGCWLRPVFDRVGLFDTDLVRNQDDELNFRTRRAGGRIWQSARIHSSYTPRASVGALFRQYVQYGYWKVAVIRKHQALAAWRHLMPALFVGSILFALMFIALAMLAGATQPARVMAAMLGAGLATYFLACVFASLIVPGALGWRSRMLMPGVIGVYQSAYGLGFLAGLLGRGRATTSSSGYFSLLTR